MLASLNWIKEFVDVEASSQEIADRLSMVGGQGLSNGESDWVVTDSNTFANDGTINPWTGTNQALMCNQHENGTLTNTPLWPWPMNQRIMDRMRAAGETVVNVTHMIENATKRLIPQACKPPRPRRRQVG